MKQKNVTKKRPKKFKISRTVQETIPYIGAYKNGIIETEEGYFTKTFRLTDVDLKTSSDEEAEKILEMFRDLINLLDPSMLMQITIDNKRVGKKAFEKNILCRMKGDALDESREEHNQILIEKSKEGHSNIQHLKYLTLSVEAKNVEDAVSQFKTLKANINKTIKNVLNEDTVELSLIERLELLYSIMNRDEGNFYRRANIDGKEVETFNYMNMKKHGLSTKDLIGPMSFSFRSSYIKMDEKYACVLKLRYETVTRLSPEIISDITDLPINMITTINIEPLDPAMSTKLVERQLTKTKKDVMDAQKTAVKGNYSAELIPEKVKKAYKDADLLLADITEEDQKMFLTNVLVMHYADSKEELVSQTKTIQSVVEKHLCKFRIMNALQELGFKDSLPLCVMSTSEMSKLSTTEETSAFVPYSTRELMQKNGFYYGLHAVSRNMIFHNRKFSVNGNGIILGMPGTGKSFSAKREMYQVALNTNDCIYIVDPQGEYTPMMKLLGGEEVKIDINEDNYLNPMDMDLGYSEKGDPITVKSDYICSICEIALGGIYGLSPIQKTIINRCVRLVYRDYMKHITELRAKDPSITIDRDAMPTLQDLYEILMCQEEMEAREIATALELYTTSFDKFSHRTNVNTNSRIVSYNIAGIGDNMREWGLTICFNNLWNQIIENHKKGIRTWIYLDEFHLLTHLDSTAEFTRKVYKMARKYGALPTGITQDVEDLLASEKARALINNCTFVYLLSQSPINRDTLQEIYSISDNQLSYITNGGYGQGLIYDGKNMIPFIDEFPSDTKLYKAMTTKPEDFVADLH